MDTGPNHLRAREEGERPRGAEVLEENEAQSSMCPAASCGSRTRWSSWADSGRTSHQEPKVASPVEAEGSALIPASGSPGERQLNRETMDPACRTQAPGVCNEGPHGHRGHFPHIGGIFPPNTPTPSQNACVLPEASLPEACLSHC